MERDSHLNEVARLGNFACVLELDVNALVFESIGVDLDGCGTRRSDEGASRGKCGEHDGQEECGEQHGVWE